MPKENIMDVPRNSTSELKIIITFSLSDEKLEIIISSINFTINKCFNNYIRELLNDRLKKSDIKIMYGSTIIYSYYDQTIGNRYIKEVDTFENNIMNVSLVYSDIFLYISNITINEYDGSKSYQIESYQNLNDKKKEVIDKLLDLLNKRNSFIFNKTLSFEDVYENIIITKFIMIILIKKKCFLNQIYYTNQIYDDFTKDKEVMKVSVNIHGNFL